MSDIVGRARLIVDPDLSNFGDRLRGESGTIERSLNNIGGGLLAGAGAAEAFARSSQDATVEIARIATVTGESEQAIRALATETSNATLSNADAIATFQTLGRQGLRTRDDLQRVTRTWDLVADATGESVVALAEAGVALRGIGIDAEAPEEALDALGFVFTTTTNSAGEFLQFIERTGPELRDLGVDIDQTAALLSILENDFGLTGRVARTEFRSAVNEANGDLNTMLGLLGVTPDRFREVTAEVGGSSQALEDMAQRFAETRTPLQQLQAGFDDLRLRLGGVGELAGNAAAGMGALGTALLGFTQARQIIQNLGGLSGILGSVRDGARALTGALTGRGGLIAGFTLAAAAGVALGGALSSALDPSNFEVSGALRQLELLSQGTRTSTEELALAIAGLNIDQPVDRFLGRLVGALPGVETAVQRTDQFFSDLNTTLGSLAQAGQGEVVAAQLETVARGAAAAGVDMEGLLDLMPGLRLELEATGALGAALEGDFEAVAAAINGAGDAAEDTAGDFNDLSAAQERGAQSLSDYLDEVKASTDPVFRLSRTLESVEAAQTAYNEAVDEFGESSREAEQAAFGLAGAIADAEAAALDGELSFADFDRQLQRWVDSGRLTASQADVMRRRVADLRGEAEDYQGTYNATLTADDLASLEIERARLEAERFARTYTATIRTARQQAFAGGVDVAAASGGFSPAGALTLTGEQGPELSISNVGRQVISRNDSIRALADDIVSALSTRDGSGIDLSGMTVVSPRPEDAAQAVITGISDTMYLNTGRVWA